MYKERKNYHACYALIKIQIPTSWKIHQNQAWR